MLQNEIDRMWTPTHKALRSACCDRYHVAKRNRQNVDTNPQSPAVGMLRQIPCCKTKSTECGHQPTKP